MTESASKNHGIDDTHIENFPTEGHIHRCSNGNCIESQLSAAQEEVKILKMKCETQSKAMEDILKTYARSSDIQRLVTLERQNQKLREALEKIPLQSNQFEMEDTAKQALGNESVSK